MRRVACRVESGRAEGEEDTQTDPGVQTGVICTGAGGSESTAWCGESGYRILKVRLEVELCFRLECRVYE